MGVVFFLALVGALVIAAAGAPVLGAGAFIGIAVVGLIIDGLLSR